MFVQELLLDFTVHYLVTQPPDILDFAVQYFRLYFNLVTLLLDILYFALQHFTYLHILTGRSGSFQYRSTSKLIKIWNVKVEIYQQRILSKRFRYDRENRVIKVLWKYRNINFYVQYFFLNSWLPTRSNKIYLFMYYTTFNE